MSNVEIFNFENFVLHYNSILYFCSQVRRIFITKCWKPWIHKNFNPQNVEDNNLYSSYVQQEFIT